MLGEKERKRELRIKISDCLDYCTAIDCSRSKDTRDITAKDRESRCYTCDNYKNIVHLRQQLENTNTIEDRNKSFLKALRKIERQSALYHKSTNNRATNIENAAKVNMPFEQLCENEGCSKSALYQWMKKNMKVQYKELVKRYAEMEGAE